MSNTTNTPKTKMNLSPIRKDELSGRRSFLTGLYISIIILILFPLYKLHYDTSVIGRMSGLLQEMDGKVAEWQSSRKAAAWIFLVIGMTMPSVFLMRGRNVFKIFKGVALVLIMPSILLALKSVRDEGSFSNFAVSFTWGPTIWSWLYLAAQVCCAVGIIQFGRNEEITLPKEMEPQMDVNERK